ncbi:DNA polymerase-4 [Reichenbachiella faecimaris]|uniref:DNA polymerase IV n=1 Tax=Reichenbachiella faecimaris TaxID=692418 RepID=A0A1W2G7Q3_REIFA|nr:DNA polymerase IV [Reichenbachiella faecimaris]SMD32534.1 DNA polymerase-4 [Reichenbachiella faecimaris]
MSDNLAIRKIIHIDMDAFYASVEQRDNPELKGKPVAVGGSRSRGVVAAASYEARKFGIRSAMPSVTAFRKCPDIIFVKPRFEVYKEVSQIIRNIFFEYTDLVEPLSLDEAYLDVTNNKIGLPSATLIAEEIRKKIFDSTALTCSAGISINKFLAKTASDINKPNGMKLIKPEEAMAFIETLKVKDFFGVGKVTAEKMKRMGIHTGLDLKNKSLGFMTKNFGKSGSFYYNISRGIDDRPVNPNRIRKSVSIENTYDNDLSDISHIETELEKLSESLETRLAKNKIQGKTINIKIKYADFEQVTRSKTSQYWLSKSTDYQPLWKEILLDERLVQKPIRLLGLGLSNLNTEEKENQGLQLTLEF